MVVASVDKAICATLSQVARLARSQIFCDGPLLAGGPCPAVTAGHGHVSLSPSPVRNRVMLQLVSSDSSDTSDHSSSPRDAPEDDEPTTQDLAAIEDEWPLIEAELGLVAAEIAVLTTEPHPSELDWVRLRLAERRVCRELLSLVNRGVPVDLAA